MAITESERHHLHQQLDASIGPDAASTLMEHLPPVGWADVATKRDLDHVETVRRGDMERMEAGIRTDMQQMEAGIRTDMQQMEAGIRTDMQQMGSDLRTEMAEIRGEVTGLRNDMTEMGAELRADMANLEARMERSIRTSIDRLRDELLGQMRSDRVLVLTALSANTAIMATALVIVGLG